MPHYQYSPADLDKLLASLVVLCDTREQKNHHILKGLICSKVNYKLKALTAGDYTALLPAAPEYGIFQPLSFADSILIERKASLEELSGNLTRGRERFKDEMGRAKGAEVHLMVEGGSWGKILGGQYQTQYKPESFYASLLSLQEQYGLHIAFIDKEYAWSYIYRVLYYHVRRVLSRSLPYRQECQTSSRAL